MFNLGMGEITVILLLVLLFVGPKKLPEMAAGLGRAIRQIRKTTADVKNEIVLDDAIRKPFEELRDAVTLAPEELKRRDDLKEAVRKQAEEFERAQREAAAAEAGDTLADPAPEPVAREGSAPWATPPANFPPPPVAVPSSPMAARPTPSSPMAARPTPSAPMAVPSTPSAPMAVPSTPSAPMAPPVGTFPRAPTPAPLPPGRLGGPPRVTPPVSSLDGRNANTTQTLTEEDLLPLKKGAPPPPLPPPLPGVPPVPGTKKG